MGWKTSDMLNGLEGVMNLAAASGEDLAMVSDIVTDALTAFGMGAEESGRFADILAAATSNANTNVAMMGETFKYVAPVAGSLGYSAEDTAVAIGLMGNAGIKASQAGTSLRQILLGLQGGVSLATKSTEEWRIETANADGTMRDLDDVLVDLRAAFADMTAEQQANNAENIAGKVGMSGLLAIVNAGEGDFNKLTNAVNNSTGAAGRMAETMQDNLKGSITKIKSALEGASISIGERLIPMLSNLADKIQSAVNWFNGLSDSTKDNIVKFGLYAIAAGPVLSITGKLVGSMSNLVKAGRGLSGALGLANTAARATAGATTAAANGVGAMGLATKLGALAFNPWVLGAGAVVGAGALVAKGLQQEVVPSIDLFAERAEIAGTVMTEYGETVKYQSVAISDATKQNVQAYLDMDRGVTETLQNLYINSTKITADNANALITEFSKMGTAITTELANDKAKDLEILQKSFADQSSLTAEEQQKIIDSVNQNYDNKFVNVQAGEARIHQILNDASANNRETTRAEQDEIDRIRLEMRDTAINAFSEQEAETQVILDRMAKYDRRVTAEMASEHVRQLNEARDKAVDKANEEYRETIKVAENMKRDGSKESQELADKLIKEAARQRDKVIEAANETRTNGISKLEESYSNLRDEIDTDSGEIMSWWDKIKTKWNEWTPQSKTLSITTSYNSVGSPPYVIGNYRPEGYATGTYSAMSGYRMVGENGPELMKLNGGERIYNAIESQRIAKDMSDRKKNVDNSALEKIVLGLEKATKKIEETLTKKEPGLSLNIEKFENNREMDIENLANELAYYIKRGE